MHTASTTVALTFSILTYASMYNCVSYYCILCFFFFFKQKTAYEMRISDWSSDVCSSDLKAAVAVSRRPDNANREIAVLPLGSGPKRGARCEIGRASCRERVCQYV